MRKKFITCLFFTALLSSPPYLKAQNTTQPQTPAKSDFFIGLLGGLNVATVGGNDVSELHTRVAFHAGIMLDFPIKQNFTIEPAVIYSDKGTSLPSADLSFQYIEFLVNLAYRWPAGYIISVGPYAGYSASFSAKNYGHQADISQYFNSSDYGINAAVGYLATKNIGIFLRYEYGLSNIWSDKSLNSFGFVKNNNQVFCMSIYLYN